MRALMGTVAVVVAILLAAAACSSGNDDDASGGGGGEPSGTAPAGLVSQVLPPADAIYVSEANVPTTGYWKGYRFEAGTSADLDAYSDVLTVLGWTVGDVSSSGLSATTDGGWLDVVSDGDRLSLCVWNEEPEPGACAAVPATFSDDVIPTPTATEDGS